MLEVDVEKQLQKRNMEHVHLSRRDKRLYCLHYENVRPGIKGLNFKPSWIVFQESFHCLPSKGWLQP